MSNMRRSSLLMTFAFCLPIVLLGISAEAMAEGLADTPENRRAAAERYFATVPPEDLLNDSIRQISLQVQEPKREEFVRTMQELMRPAEIRRIAFDAMVKHFTAGELDALARFFGSPEGQAFVKKYKLFVAEIQPFMQAELTRIVRELQARQRVR